MTKNIVILATMILVFYTSLAIGADPNIRQIQPPQIPTQRGSNIPQLQLTLDYLSQQITALQQQVRVLQAQVNTLRSVVQITPKGTTILSEHLTLNGGQSLALISSQNMGLTAGDFVLINGGKDIELKSQKDLSSQAASQIKLKAPQIKMNDGTKPIALQDSPVAGGKIISGSSTIFAK